MSTCLCGVCTVCNCDLSYHETPMLPPDPEWVKRVEILRSDPENKEAKEWIARFLKERYGE